MSNGYDKGIPSEELLRLAFTKKGLKKGKGKHYNISVGEIVKGLESQVKDQEINQTNLTRQIQQQRASDTRGTTRKDSQPKPTTDSGVDTAYRQNMVAATQALTKQLTQDQAEFKGMSRDEGAIQGGLGMVGAAAPIMAANPWAALAMVGAGAFMGSKKAKAARQQWDREIAEKRKLIEEEREEQRKQNYYNRRQSAFNNLMQSLNQAMS